MTKMSDTYIRLDMKRTAFERSVRNWCILENSSIPQLGLMPLMAVLISSKCVLYVRSAYITGCSKFQQPGK